MTTSFTDRLFWGAKKKAHVVLPTAPVRLASCPMFILLHSFAGDRFSWIKHAPHVIQKLAQDSIVVLPESGRRWFIDDYSGERYEHYLIDELIPLTQAELANSGPISIGGFSMGGASAFFLAARHPHVFDAALAVSGAFFAPDRQGDPYHAFRSDGLMMPTIEEHERVWGPPGSPVRDLYNPSSLIEGLRQSRERPKFYFEVGRHDFPRVRAASEQMRELLETAGIDHAFSVHAGAHDWDYAAQAMNRLIGQYRNEAS